MSNHDVERLDSVIQYVKKNIPYYKEFCDLCTIEDFSIIDKSIIKQGYDKFISDEFALIRSNLTSILSNKIWFDKRTIEKKYSDNIIIEKTSGSSGVPFYCVKSVEERMKLGYEIWYARKKIDHKVNADNFLPVNHNGMKNQVFNYRDMSIENILELYRFICENNIRWIHIQARIILEHLKILKKAGLSIHCPTLKYYELNGDFLGHEDIIEIENFFGVTVINHYGMIEMWQIATKYSNNNFKVLDKNVYFEIVDSENNVIKENYKSGRLIISSLNLKLMPFIRYDTGDYGYYKEDGGFELLPGREINVVKGINQMVFGNVYFSKVIKRISYTLNCTGLLNVRIIQKSEELFQIYTNNFENRNVFIEELHSEIEKLMERKIVVQSLYETIEDYQKNTEKKNLFISEVKNKKNNYRRISE